MDSISKPLAKLYEDGAWFVRKGDVRLLRVRCSPSLCGPALEVLAGQEALASNRRAYVILAEPHTRDDDGWRARAAALERHWEERRAASLLDGLELGEIEPAPPATGHALADFAVTVTRVLRAIRAPLEGVVVILAPSRIESLEALVSGLTELLSRPELSGARWILLDAAQCPLDPLIERLGDAAMDVECVVDDAAFAADLSSMAAGMDPEVQGPARAGAAWPRGVLPPMRPGQPAPTQAQLEERDLELAAAGVNTVLAGPEGARMQQRTLAAAACMKPGSIQEAVTHQLEAVRIAYDAGATREALLQHMILAGYYHAASLEPEAWREYATVAQRATEWGCLLEEAQSRLALGLIDARAGRRADAVAQYAAAAAAAERAGAEALAVECWRVAGELALASGAETAAAEHWQRAIDIAYRAGPAVERSSSAPVAATQLATILRARGLTVQAESLEERARRLLAGELR